MDDAVQRTCTKVCERDYSEDGSEGGSRSFEDFRGMDAYILLGAPGAGKTTEFRRQAELSDGRYVSARDLVTYQDKPEWRGVTLFIDGLDESRAGSADGRAPLDSICEKLYRLGHPKFRLSCREADWFGANDRNRLIAVSRNSKVTVLRLDPLSGESIREILCRHDGIEDADGFVDSARKRGIDDLLANPQSLTMLAKAVVEGTWPQTRKRTFDMACRTLLKEHNQGHRIARSDDDIDISALMGVAGRLCAVQLLTGVAGYALPGEEGSHDFPALNRIPGKDRRTLLHALKTKLFEAPEEGRTAPVHRQVAEFLAARFLAGRIGDGLPLGRILALMTGYDGAVVSELRGLSAWLAAHSRPSRAEIIARDPLGTVLYGDVREFSTEEKRRLLEGLEREAKKDASFLRKIRRDPRWGDIATPDMDREFRTVLTDPARHEARQLLVLIILEILKNGRVLPELVDLMSGIVRDKHRKRWVRAAALRVFLRPRETGQPAAADLKALVEDIEAEPNPDGGLLGSLLIELYPAHLSVLEVLQYLRSPETLSYFGRDFTGQIAEKSTAPQLGELLDGIAADFGQHPPVYSALSGPNDLLRHALLRWLKHFLEAFPDQVSPDRLFIWFGAASHPELRVGGVDARFFREWLSRHPEVYKEIVKRGVTHCVGRCFFDNCMYEMERRLFQADWPPDFGSWCLDRAMAADDPDAAAWFMDKVALAVHRQRDDEELSRSAVESCLAGNASLQHRFAEEIGKLENGDERWERQRGERETETRRKHETWCAYVKPHEAALRENRGQPMLLRRLAEAYFGVFIGVEGETGRERLKSLLGNDPELIEAVLDGFKGSIRREDLPTEDEVMHLGTRHPDTDLAAPFMAGLEERVRTPPTDETTLDESRMRLALTIHYTAPKWVFSEHYEGRPPDWFPPWLEDHPEIISDVLVQSARFKLRNGETFADEIHELAHSEDYAGMARLVSLPLLEGFPVRCRERQLQTLNHLLKAALLHCEDAPLLELIEARLARRSMNAAQRIYWLAAGFLASPESYSGKLESCVAGKERRARRLLEVAANRYDTSRDSIPCLGVPALQLLIRLAGPYHKPSLLDSGSAGGRAWRPAAPSESIRGFIDQLASVPSPAATEALETLSADEGLRAWRIHLEDAVYRQNVLRREAGFKHFNMEQVLQTLGNCKPANAADLAALTFEYLCEISRNIRDGNTSDWRQYWNVDSYNRPTEPKPEEGCRDALLSDLNQRLQRLGIDAQPEGLYADDKRSDIRVSYNAFNVPVEIKKSCHRGLWSAIKSQLIAKYTRDPGADGYGIYLVFWFGVTEHCRPTPGDGAPPKSAEELEKRLRGTLSAEHELKIKVCVIDVSKPVSPNL